MKKGTIYIIKNKINKKVYIGQTTININERFKQHMKNSTINSKKQKFYRAIKKYGRKNFYIEALENDIDENKLNEKEIYYIDKYNSFFDGYNSTKGGKGRIINKKSDYKKIIELYNKGYSTNEISNIFNVSGETILRVLKRLNIKTRHDGNKYERMEKNEFISLWENKQVMIKDMAKKYNVNEKTIRRHAKRLNLNKKGVKT